MNILLDLDGVMSDFFTEALNRLNEKFHRTVSADDYIKHNEFNMAKIFGITTQDFWHTLEGHDDFWCNLKPFPWAVELFEFLSSKGEVTICTSPSHHPICASQKVEWCIDHLKINSNQLMIGGRKYLMAKQGSILIDDYEKNVVSFNEAGGTAIHVPSNWNTPNLTLEKIKVCLPF